MHSQVIVNCMSLAKTCELSKPEMNFNLFYVKMAFQTLHCALHCEKKRKMFLDLGKYFLNTNENLQ